MSLEKADLKGLRLKGERWYEIDDIQDLSNAETIFCSEEDRPKEYFQRWGGYWRFPSIKDFCFLVNPYFPPPVMEEEIKAYFHELISSYPSGQRVQRLLASKMFKCLPEQIVVGNGAAELINALMSDSKERVGIVIPTFHEYANRVGFENCAQLVPLEKNRNFQFTIDEIKAFAVNIDTFILINPDNPTGHYLPREKVVELASWFHDSGKHLIVDESFVDFSTESEHGSLLNQEDLEMFPSLLVVKSISKSYGVPGVRLGVLASADKNLIRRVERGISIWNINSFAEFFLQIIGKYEKAYIEATSKVRNERDRFFRKLSEISYLRVITSQANFFTCEIVDKFTSEELCRTLLCKHQILIKDCKGKPGFLDGEYVRIAVRNEADNDLIVKILRIYEP